MKPYQLTDPRLLAVADYVGKGGVTADIGTDHGHLICYLVTHGISTGGYACDVGAQPLAKAEALVRALGLEGSIQTLLTDGLLGLPLDTVTDVVVAGMGGELIADILDRSLPSMRPERNLILQPMTKAERLRRFLAEKGFALHRERGVRAGGFVYPVMHATYTGEPLKPDELFCWTGRLPENPHPDSADLLKKTRRQLLATAEGLQKSRWDKEKAGACFALAEEIEQILNRRSDR